jgi:hypothetical protein
MSARTVYAHRVDLLLGSYGAVVSAALTAVRKLAPKQRAGVALLLCLVGCQYGVAADLALNLQMQAGGHQLSSKRGAVSSLTVKAGEPLEVEWLATNPAGSPALSDVTLHVFMDRDRSSGRAEAAKVSPNAAYESAVILDLRPGATTSGKIRMPAPEPGVYLFVAETIGTGKQLGRETHAAIQVAVQ